MESLNFLDAAEKVLELRNGKKYLKNLSIEAIAKITARNNLMKSNYFGSLKEKLIKDGYQITEVITKNEESDDILEASLRKTKNVIDFAKAENINNAEDISEETFEKLNRKEGLKENQRNQVAKFKIKKALPELPLSPEFIFDVILKDRWQTINGITNYYLAQNPEIAQKIDCNNITYAVEQAQKSGIYWSRDHKFHSHLRVIFDGLNIQSLIDRLEPITSNELKQFVRSANQFRRLLASLNIKWHKQTQPLIVLKKILKLFGFNASNVSKSKKLSLYRVMTLLPTYHEAIYSAIKTKYSRELILKKPENLTNCYEETKSYTEKGFNQGGGRQDNNIYSGEDPPKSNPYGVSNTADKSEMKEKPRKNVNVERKREPETNNLVGREVTYMHPVDWEQRGIIDRIEDAVYWIRDVITNEFIPCLDYQVEFT